MNIYDYTKKELEEYFLSIGEKKFRASQVVDWLYKKMVSSFDEMTNLRQEVIDRLKKDFVLNDFRIKQKKISTDGTTKFLFELSDGNLIETVVMEHEYGLSICVTSEVGCNMGCAFCASGLLKKIRNLTPAEMILQVINATKEINKRISSIVVMGIGEPFDNYDAVIKFIKMANDPKMLEIGARHITVSTCGLIDGIRKYAFENIQTNLAISLHAATNEKRNMIMKINKRYPLEVLFEAIKDYINITKRRVTLEYILIKDFNDKEEDVEALASLVKGLNVYINLIPYNEVSENGFKRSQKQTMSNFYDKLKKKGIDVTLRHEYGHDIDAACGQLRAKNLA